MEPDFIIEEEEPMTQTVVNESVLDLPVERERDEEAESGVTAKEDKERTPLKKPKKRVTFRSHKESNPTRKNHVTNVYGKQFLKPVTEEIVVHPFSPEKVFAPIQSQEYKYWHFMFRNHEKEDELKRAVERLGYHVQFNYGGQKHPDMSITSDNGLVGQIHFLHCDRRDFNKSGMDKKKYYVKLYFFKFREEKEFHEIHEAVVPFFKRLFPVMSRASRTHHNRIPNQNDTKRKRNLNRYRIR
jgi:hypothetical protein